MTESNLPVIVIAAYGTADPAAQKALEGIDTLVRNRFPGYDVRWAITAKWLITRLLKSGQTTLFNRRLPVKNLEDIYKDLRAEGKTRVAVQCLLVHDGVEADIVYQTPVGGLAVKYGRPLLSDKANINATIKAVAGYFGGSDAATVLIGHGVEDNPSLNAPFLQMEAYVRKNYSNVFMTTIHGPPGTESAFAGVIAAGAKRVIFVPLMITNSEHILHEVVAETPDSWKSQLGLPFQLAPSLAETSAVSGIYLESIAGILAQFKQA